MRSTIVATLMKLTASNSHKTHSLPVYATLRNSWVSMRATLSVKKFLT